MEYTENSLVKITGGDTDSLYLCYNQLLSTIEGWEDMSLDQQLNILVKFNTEFLDKHNHDFIDEYYKSKHGKSVHDFELETISLNEIRLDVKKRYAQILLWKDDKFFDKDNLPLKVKGLEMVKSSYPKQAREILKKITRFYLEEQDDAYMLQKLNIKMQELKHDYMVAPIEEICGNINVNNYTKYILDDNNQESLKVGEKCPATVRALGNYNFIRNKYNLPGDPLYGGKMKVYMYYPTGSTSKDDPSYFAFRSMDYPEWAEKFAPVAREKMFQQYVLDPFNRIIESNGIGTLNNDGSIEMSLFDF